MSHDHSRRPSTTHFSPSQSIPNAPPLPAPRPLQRARDAATRLFGYSSRPPSPQEDERILNSSKTRFASLTATQNATASHRTGLEINTLSINEAGTHALIGGKEIFKTVRVENGTCVEELNLRSAIRSNPRQASGKVRQVYSINIADVAWAKGDCGDYVAAATSSGKIILYDLGHAGLQAAQLHEHFRHVHKVTFNPHRGNLLLSGSQDGTVRLWDVRDVRQANTLRSKHKYSGQADGIRDVKWSPTEGFDFAFGTDSGWIQRWDMRNLRNAKVKIPAHTSTCNAIDWHPDGKHIASASADKTVRVWDFSANRKQKAHWEIRTPHPVSNARWRPSCESPSIFESGARQCTQIITAYDSGHTSLHVWDLRRPALPFRELSPHVSAPTDLLWHSQDLLWTVGKDGAFLQTDIQHATKSISKRNLQAIAISMSNEISLVTQRRWRQRLPRAHNSHSNLAQATSLGRSPPNGLLSRSWADDSLDHSFLSVPPTKRDVSPRTKSRTQSLSLAASNNDIRLGASIAHLDDVLAHRKAFRPHQAAARGMLDICGGSCGGKEFSFLARNLVLDLHASLRVDDFIQSFEELMYRNADLYEAVGVLRFSQSIRMISYITSRHLEERADAKKKVFSASKGTEPVLETQHTLIQIARRVLEKGDITTTSPPVMRPRSALAQQIAQSEIASSNRTPVQRPVIVKAPAKSHIAEPVNDDGLSELHPVVTVVPDHEQPTGEPATQLDADPPLTSNNLAGLQLQQETGRIDRTDMVRRWSIQPKEPLRLEPVDDKGIWIPPKLQKHDSNESFAFLAESSDSRDPSFPSSFASNGSGSGPLRMVSERPSRRDMSGPGGDSGVAAVDFGSNALSPSMQSPIKIPKGGTSPRMDAASKANRSKPPPGVLVNGDNVMEPSPDVGPGSYPDENGISPLLEMKMLQQKQQQEQQRSAPRESSAKRSTTSKASVHERSASNLSAEKSASASASLQRQSSIYFPDPVDPDVESEKPFTLLGMLRELIAHHSGKGNAQAAAQLVLTLGPLLPLTHPLPNVEIEATVRAYIDVLTSTGFAPENMLEVMDEYLDPLSRSGLQPLQIEAIFETYHEQLTRHGLLCEAAALRKLAYPAYPAVYEQALNDNYIHLRCGSCGKPIVSGMSDLLCETCNISQAGCPVCYCDDSPMEATQNTLAHLFTTCLLCNHSGHATCMESWFGDSNENDGGCPFPGCLCDCVHGSWRVQKAEMAEKRRRTRYHSRIKSDDWSTQESNAVERTRAMFAKGEKM